MCSGGAETVSVPAMLSVVEGEGSVQVCATLTVNAAISAALPVTLSTSDDSGM